MELSWGGRRCRIGIPSPWLAPGSVVEEGIRCKKASPPLAVFDVIVVVWMGSGLLLVLVGVFPFSRSFPLSEAGLVRVMGFGAFLLLRLMSAFPSLRMVSVVSFSFCFILMAVIVGTSLGFGTGSRILADVNAARFPVFIVGEMRFERPMILLLFGESSFRIRTLDGAANAEAFKRCCWWASSPLGETTPVPTPARAAARSLEDLVVRIGWACCWGC